MLFESKQISLILLASCSLIPILRAANIPVLKQTVEANNLEIGLTIPTDFAYSWDKDTFAIWGKKSSSPRQDAPITISDWFWYRATDGKTGVEFVINNVAASGASHIWWRTFGGGWAEYKSSVDEVTQWTPPGSDEESKNFDSLQEAVEFGHNLDLKVYAWFPFLEEWHGWKENSRSKYTDIHQDLSDQDVHGYKTGQASFYYEKYRNYKLQIVRELVARYAIDGLVLDFERQAHRNNQWGYLPAIVNGFQSETKIDVNDLSPGNEAWMAYRAKYIGDFVRQTSELINQAQKPMELIIWNVSDRPLSAHCDLKAWSSAGFIKNIAVFKHGKTGWGSATPPPKDLYESLQKDLQVDRIYYGLYAGKNNDRELSNWASAALGQGFNGLVWFESTPVFQRNLLNIIRRFSLVDNFVFETPLIDMSGGGEIIVICSSPWSVSINEQQNEFVRGSAGKILKFRLPIVSGNHKLIFNCKNVSDKIQFSGIAFEGFAIDIRRNKKFFNSNPGWLSQKGTEIVKTGRPGIPPFLGN